MTKHTSSCIIYDDTWSSLYCYFDRTNNEWFIRIRTNMKYFVGKGASLQAAVVQVQHKIAVGACEQDLKDFSRGDNKPLRPNVAVSNDDNLEDLF